MTTDNLDAPELEGDIKYIETPKAKPSAFLTGQDCGVELTNVSRPVGYRL
jgi:hypothetical protein